MNAWLSGSRYPPRRWRDPGDFALRLLWSVGYPLEEYGVERFELAGEPHKRCAVLRRDYRCQLAEQHRLTSKEEVAADLGREFARGHRVPSFLEVGAQVLEQRRAGPLIICAPRPDSRRGSDAPRPPSADTTLSSHLRSGDGGQASMRRLAGVGRSCRSCSERAIGRRARSAARLPAVSANEPHDVLRRHGDESEHVVSERLGIEAEDALPRLIVGVV